MLLFQKLVDETQMPKPQECTDTFILTKKLFLVGLLGLQNISNPVERPCSNLFGCITNRGGGKHFLNFTEFLPFYH